MHMSSFWMLGILQAKMSCVPTNNESSVFLEDMSVACLQGNIQLTSCFNFNFDLSDEQDSVHS